MTVALAVQQDVETKPHVVEEVVVAKVHVVEEVVVGASALERSSAGRGGVGSRLSSPLTLPSEMEAQLVQSNVASLARRSLAMLEDELLWVGKEVSHCAPLCVTGSHFSRLWPR